MKIKYSPDFDFFLKHQIGTVSTNNGRHVTWFSRLESKNFKEIDGSRELSDQEIKEECFKIHQEQVLKTA